MISVMQPTLFPWLGYFDLIDQSDIFVFYTDVQFSKQSWQTRNRISTKNGIMLFSIPTLKCDLNTNIENVFIDTNNLWNKKFLKTLKYNYVNSKHFTEIIGWFNEFLSREFLSLQEINITFIQEVSEKIGINTVFKKSSDLNIENSDRIERLIEIGTLHDANTYLSTIGSFQYLDGENAMERFLNNHIQILFHHYHPMQYNTGKLPYEPYMSIIDVLFNCGFDETLAIIRAGRKPNFSFEEYKMLQDAK